MRGSMAKKRNEAAANDPSSPVRQWAREHEVSLMEVARRAGISYGCLHQAARGEPVSVEAALKISAATSGAVTVAALCGQVIRSGWSV